MVLLCKAHLRLLSCRLSSINRTLFRWWTSHPPSSHSDGSRRYSFTKELWPTSIVILNMECKLQQIVAASVSISKKAGTIITDIMKSGELGVIEKGKNDLQTEADRSAQRCIVASLSRLFPDVKIIGEEGEEDKQVEVPPSWLESHFDETVMSQTMPAELTDVKTEDIVIWVDPLDGTSEYTQGLLDHVTVLIGICFNGKAIAGVIRQPYFNYKQPDLPLGRTIWGIVGLGAFGFHVASPPEGENIITTTRSHSNKTVTDAVQACQPSSVLRAGGCGHKVMLVLEGEAHAYVFASPGCKKWDTAAPEAILHAAAGKLTDIHGNCLEYHKDVKVRNAGGVLAVANADKHDWYLSKIPQSVKDDLPA